MKVHHLAKPREHLVPIGSRLVHQPPLFPSCAEVVRRSLALNSKPSEGGPPRHRELRLASQLKDVRRSGAAAKEDLPPSLRATAGCPTSKQASAGKPRNSSCHFRNGRSAAHRKPQTITRSDAGCYLAVVLSMAAQKFIVYLLRSTRVPTRYYSGLTSSVEDRIAAHNGGCRRIRRPDVRGNSSLPSNSRIKSARCNSSGI